MDPEASISLEREELLRHILPLSSLEYCQSEYPGTIKLEIVRRTSVLLLVRRRPLRFHLSQDDHGSVELKADGRILEWLTQRHPALWGLSKHIACEAMLALRNGHKEHVRTLVRKKRTPKQTADVS